MYICVCVCFCVFVCALLCILQNGLVRAVQPAVLSYKKYLTLIVFNLLTCIPGGHTLTSKCLRSQSSWPAWTESMAMYHTLKNSIIGLIEL